MEKSKMGKLFIIIACIAITISVLIINMFVSEEEQNQKIIEELEIDLDKGFSTDAFSEAVDSLNQNDAGITTGDQPIAAEKEASFNLLYTEVLFNRDIPEEALTKLESEIEDYLNIRYGDKAVEITSVAILEESIKADQDDKNIEFGIRLDKGSTADYATININLETYEYIFIKVDI